MGRAFIAGGNPIVLHPVSSIPARSIDPAYIIASTTVNRTQQLDSDRETKQQPFRNKTKK